MKLKYLSCFVAFLTLGFYSKAQDAHFYIGLFFENKSIKIAENQWFITKNGDSIQFSNIKLYLSNIALKNEFGNVIPDNQKAHLLDFEDAETYHLKLNLHDNTPLSTVHFCLGIDSTTNVLGAQAGDLDPTKGMYWAWQSGFINFKIEGISPQCRTRKQAFQFHIGGFLSPFYAMRTLTFALPKSVANTWLIRIDLAHFFEKIHLSEQNQIMQPNKNAMQMADFAIKMFEVLAYEK